MKICCSSFDHGNAGTIYGFFLPSSISSGMCVRRVEAPYQIFFRFAHCYYRSGEENKSMIIVYCEFELDTVARVLPTVDKSETKTQFRAHEKQIHFFFRFILLLCPALATCVLSIAFSADLIHCLSRNSSRVGHVTETNEPNRITSKPKQYTTKLAWFLRQKAKRNENIWSRTGTHRHANGINGNVCLTDGRKFCVRFSGKLWLNFNLTPHFGTDTAVIGAVDSTVTFFRFSDDASLMTPFVFSILLP